MKTALILGTNAGQADIIKYLMSKNWTVHACGHVNSGPGVELADHFHLADIVDESIIIRLAEKINPDIIYSVSSDLGINTATRVSEKLGLPHLLNSELIDLFHYKDKLRSWLNEHNLSTVAFNYVTSPEESESWSIFPCVVKPVDSHGQRGISLVYHKDELASAVSSALNQSVSSAVIIEEYLEGVEASSHVIIQDGNCIIKEFTERYVHPLPFIGLPSGHAIPIRNADAEQLHEASNLIENLIDALNVSDAVLYIQFKFTPNGPKIIEIMPRLDGCHIWRLIQHSKGYDLREYAIKCLTGEKINHRAEIDDPQPYTLLFHQIKSGEPFYKAHLNVNENMAYNEFRYNDGDIVTTTNGRLEVAGYYLKEG